jgi:hypothetical protein
MTDHPAPQPAEIAALMRDHGGAWQIEYTASLDVWTAVRKSPRHVRVVVARTPGELAAKLADAGDPPDLPAPGIAHPGGGWISGPSNPA